MADEVEQLIARVAETAGPAVVGIGTSWGQGSGVVVGEGRVLTNAHNVHHEPVRVTFSGGREVDATVVAADPDGDLIVLAADTAGVAALAWSSETPAHGIGVVALANPGGRGLRATFGRVSAVDQSFRGPRGRRITGSFEHTAPLARGSSGGPVVDTEGRLVGINVNRLGEGFYLALPADEALRTRLDSLLAGKSAQRRRLGLALAPTGVASKLRAAVGLPERSGLLVREVEPGSPAEGAGIRTGDLVVRVGDVEVASVDDLQGALDGEEPRLTIGLVRGAEDLTVEVSFEPASS